MPRMSRSTLVLFYTTLIAAALLVRVALIADKQTIEHDEAISYLAATGHLNDYVQVVTAGQFPYNEWATARDWQRFVEPDKALIFGPIASDLAHYDLHPPLYFWLLHVWSLMLGVAPWTGPLLNLLIDVATGLVLYRLARGSLSPGHALAAVLLWGLSPVALLTMLPARPYSLFTLCAVLYALAIRSAFSSTPNAASVKRLIAVIIIGAAGLLTHFYFFLALVAGGAIVLIRRDRAQLAVFVWCTALTGALFVGLFPLFLEPVRHKVQGAFALNAFPDRLTVMVSALAMLSIPTMAAFTLPVMSAAVRRVWPYARPSAPRPTRPVTPERFRDEVFLLCLLGGQMVLYLLQISPTHTLMEYRYLGPVWPFAALVIVRTLDSGLFDGSGATRLPLACLGMLLLVAGVAWPHEEYRARPESSTHVLIDNPARGVLLPVVIQLDGETPVFAAEQTDLLADPGRWLPVLRRDGGLYSHLPSYNATAAGHAAILDLIAAKAAVYPAPEPFIWQDDFHRDTEQVVCIAPYRLSRSGKGC
jgi:uncharacterized membrane protein